MRIHLFVLATLLLAGLPLVPQAAAHACGAATSDCVCPVPNDGKTHSHAGPTGSCTNGASATPGGASATPGAGLFALLGIFVVAAVLVRRRS